MTFLQVFFSNECSAVLTPEEHELVRQLRTLIKNQVIFGFLNIFKFQFNIILLLFFVIQCTFTLPGTYFGILLVCTGITKPPS